MTPYQERQAADIRRETAKRIDELKKAGAVARIGYFHYPKIHTNLNTLDTIEHNGRSRCVKGDDPMAALTAYARQVWGSGTLRLDGRTQNSDGTFSASYLVIPQKGQSK